MEYVLATMFVAGGGLFTFLGYKALAINRKKRAEWVAVEGTVIDFSEQAGEKGKTLYAPIYRYILDGVEHAATSTVASRPPDYRVGDPIAILVNPTRSDESDVAGGTDLVIYTLIGMGLLALALGLFLGWLAYTGQMAFG
jgi:hypothetical protein